MNTQDKINSLTSLAVSYFEEGLTLDQVCGQVVPQAIEDGIGFTEIMPLVKTIGKKHGFIVELADRKANFTKVINNTIAWPSTYEDLELFIKEFSLQYDVPIKWAAPVYKDAMARAGNVVPVKPTLSGWKFCALECWRHDLTFLPSRKNVQDALIKDGHNHHKYTQAYHELFTALTAL